MLLTVQETAERLRINVVQVRLLIRRGKLRASNIGLSPRKKQYRISVAALEEFLRRTEIVGYEAEKPVRRRRRRRPGAKA